MLTGLVPSEVANPLENSQAAERRPAAGGRERLGFSGMLESGKSQIMPVSPQPDTLTGPAADVERCQGRLLLRCPACARDLVPIRPGDAPARLKCPSCGFVFLNRDGVWKALAPDREAHFRRFRSEYATVRATEGRGSSGPDFYLALPYRDLTGCNRWQWRIRGRSFGFFQQHVLSKIERRYGRALDILDLGAGNCWMSYRLALRGHFPAAVDLLDGAEDGLHAARHYFPHLASPFPRFQADMDHLPFADRQCDLAVFNASFHYSENYQHTAGEALRCLRRPGYLIILDSPFYTTDENGRLMVKERKAAFKQRFGFASDSIPSLEYLTAGTLKELAHRFGLSWVVEEPWYGLAWALRPLKARILGRRQPAKFFVVWAEVA